MELKDQSEYSIDSQDKEYLSQLIEMDENGEILN